MDTTLLISGIALAGIGGHALLSYNQLVSLRRRCQRAEADIDVQLRHRHDLVPQLVETARGFINQESAMFGQLVNAWKAAASATSLRNRMEAENIVSNSLQNVMAALNSYPELQSSEHFRELRNEILDVENKLNAARRFLNLAADEYNAALDRFPGVFIARLAGLKAYRYYSVGAERPIMEEAPTLQF